jgi:hypothetical protein
MNTDFLVTLNPSPLVTLPRSELLATTLSEARRTGQRRLGEWLASKIVPKTTRFKT